MLFTLISFSLALRISLSLFYTADFSHLLYEEIVMYIFM